MNEFDIINKLNSKGLLAKRIAYDKPMRCATVTHPRHKNGFFIVNTTIGMVGWKDWANSLTGYFFLDEEKTKSLTKEDWDIIKREQERINQLEQIERQKEIDRYQRILPRITHKATTHPYLEKKCVTMQHDFVVDKQGNLLIPVYGIDKKVKGYQLINEDKKFKTGTSLKGNFYPIRAKGTQIEAVQVFFLVEGVATGLSLQDIILEYLRYDGYMIDYHMVICCFSSNNIDNVARLLHNMTPHAVIIAIKDADNVEQGIKTKGFQFGIRNGEDVNDMLNKFGLHRCTVLFHNELAKGFKKPLEDLKLYNMIAEL